MSMSSKPVRASHTIPCGDRSESELTRIAMQKCPPDVFGLAEQLGIRLHAAELPDDMAGDIFPSRSGWVIRYNCMDGPSRQRLTVAHMLGHHLLHRHLLKEGDRPGTNADRNYHADRRGEHASSHIAREHEVEASRHALRLLMPMELVRPLLQETGDIEEVARMLAVTSKALRLRINSQTRSVAVPQGMSR